MKIAILGSFNFHFECIGFILEVFKNNVINIYIKKNSDQYGFLKHYSTLYKFNIKYDCFTNDIIKKYDIVFKLTSNDYCLDDKKIISILHLNQPTQLKCKSKHFLSLTPYIQGKNIHYTFPIYNPIIEDTKYNNMITMIGYYKNEYFDSDTLSFINSNKNYMFNFIICGSKNYQNLKNIKNVNIYNGINTSDMIAIINKSKYILSKKYINYDRFSGQLGIAMSFEIPLIIDFKTKTKYNLPGIHFIKEYSELKHLDNISNIEYTNLKNEIKIKKQEILDNNKLILLSKSLL